MEHPDTYEIIENSRELCEKYSRLRDEIRAAIAELRRNREQSRFVMSLSPDGVITADTPRADVPVQAERAKFTHLPE